MKSKKTKKTKAFRMPRKFKKRYRSVYIEALLHLSIYSKNIKRYTAGGKITKVRLTSDTLKINSFIVPIQAAERITFTATI